MVKEPTPYEVNHLSIPEKVRINNQEKFETLRSMNRTELISYRKENLPGLNEISIAIIDPEFYLVAKTQVTDPYDQGNQGILPTQLSMRWREMNDDEIKRYLFELYPYSALSDLIANKSKDFPGENNSLAQQIRIKDLMISTPFTQINEDEEDVIGKNYTSNILVFGSKIFQFDEGTKTYSYID